MTRHGTGGGVVPTLNAFDQGDTRATVVIVFSHTQGLDAQPSETVSPTLRLNGAGMAVAVYPIDDGREVEKKQNGTGIGDDGAPSYTLDRQQHASVAVAVDTYNGAIDDVAQTVRGGGKGGLSTDKYGAMMQTSQVRRLTPMECERLQGFPDGWTEGQSDSARYRQMGNAVAVPCVEWIVQRLVEVDRDQPAEG